MSRTIDGSCDGTRSCLRREIDALVRSLLVHMSVSSQRDSPRALHFSLIPLLCHRYGHADEDLASAAQWGTRDTHVCDSTHLCFLVRVVRSH